jgi:hypothetical protein
MKSRLTIYLIPLLLIVFSSCSNKSSVPVPVDAAFVLHIDGKSLHSKLSWEEFKQGELYKSIYENLRFDKDIRKLIENPDSTGIDIQSDAFLFVTARGRGGYTGFTCSLKDEKTFANLVKEEWGKNVSSTIGDITVMKDDNVVVSWNPKRAVVIINTPLGAAYSPFSELGKEGGSGGNSRRYDFPYDSLEKFALEVYSAKGSRSLGSNKRFSSMMNESGDAHFWVNPGNMYGASLGVILGMLPKAGVLLQDNATAATLNFENGKISVDAKSYYNKELTALYKKYSMKNLDEDMLKKIPSSDVAAVIAANYPPEGLKEFLVLLGVDGIINMFLGQMNYSLDEFVKANKGDILFAATDFAIRQTFVKYGEGKDTMSYPTTKPGVKLLFASSINDKASFEKLMGLLQKKIDEEAPSVFKGAASNIPYRLVDNWFIAGSDSVMINSFGNSSSNHSFISRISGHPIGGFADIQKFINGSRAAYSRDSLATAMADESVKFWQDLIFYGGEFKDDATLSHLEINLVDKTGNSLKQLNSYLGKVAAIAERKKDEFKISEIHMEETSEPDPISAQ